MISKSKILLASTALIAVAGTASAADTAVTTANAVTGTNAAQLTHTDTDASTSVNVGDTVATDGDIAAELNTGNSGVVITNDVAGVLLNIDHDVTTTGATAIQMSAQGNVTIDTGINVTGATNAILVDNVTSNITVNGTATGNIDSTASVGSATILTVAGTVTGDALLGGGINTITLTGGTVGGAFTGGSGTDTMTSTGTSSVGTTLSNVENINVNGGTLTVGGNITGATNVNVNTGAELLAGADVNATTLTINGGAATTSTVAGDVTATTLNVNSGTLDTEGNITATTATVASGATLDMASGEEFTGTTLNVNGTLATAGTVTVNAAIVGGNGATIGDITLGAAGHSVTSNGSNFAAITGGAGTDSVVTNGTSSISGDVTGIDTLVVTSGTLDADGDITAATTTVNAGSTLDMANTMTHTGTLNLNGTLTTAGVVTLDGATAVAATANLGSVTVANGNDVTIESGATTGTITAAGTTDVILNGAHNMSSLAMISVDDLRANGALTLDTDVASTAITNLEVTGTGSLVTNGNTVDADVDLLAGSTVTGALALGNGGRSIDTDGQTLSSVTGGTGVDTLDAAGVTTVTGNITAMENVDVTGDLVLGGSTAPTAGLLVTGTMNAAEVTTTVDATVNSGYEAAFNGTSTIAGDLDVAGDLTVDGTSTTVTGTTDVTGAVKVLANVGGTAATFNAGTLADVDTKVQNITLELGTNLAESGKLSTTSNLDFNNGTVGLEAAQGVVITTSDTTGVDMNGIVSGAATAALTGTTLSQGNAIYDYTWSEAGNQYNLNVKLKDAAVTTLEGAATTGFKALAAQLENTGTGSSTNTADLYKSVFAQADTAKTLEGVASDVTGGLQQTLINAVQGSAKSIDSRMASLRGHSGVAAGDMASNGNMWVKAFGTTATQDAQTGSAGYDGETFGVTYGVDSDNIVEGATVGLAISYADSNVDTAAGSDTDVTSYQITGYGSKDLGDRTYVDAQIGFAYNDYESTRTSLGDTYNGDFDGFQGMASVEAGRSYDWNGATVTPKAGLQYIMSSTDTYTETGTGSNALTVDNEDTSALYARVGADMAWDMSTESGVQYRPFVKAGLSYDLIGDEAEARSSFATGNAFTVKGAEAEEFAVELGAGVEVFSTNGVDVTLGYDAVLKDNYDAHTGSVKARWAF